MGLCLQRPTTTSQSHCLGCW